MTGKEKGERQDHIACRATQEGREEQNIGLYRKIKPRLALSQSNPLNITAQHM